MLANNWKQENTPELVLSLETPDAVGGLGFFERRHRRPMRSRHSA